MTYRVDGVLINFANSTGSQEEAAAYLSHALERHPGWSSRLSCLTVQMDGEDALLDYTLSGPRFERIRRITGYLVRKSDLEAISETGAARHSSDYLAAGSENEFHLTQRAVKRIGCNERQPR